MNLVRPRWILRPGLTRACLHPQGWQKHPDRVRWGAAEQALPRVAPCAASPRTNRCERKVTACTGEHRIIAGDTIATGSRVQQLQLLPGIHPEMHRRKAPAQPCKKPSPQQGVGHLSVALLRLREARQLLLDLRGRYFLSLNGADSIAQPDSFSSHATHAERNSARSDRSFSCEADRQTSNISDTLRSSNRSTSRTRYGLGRVRPGVTPGGSAGRLRRDQRVRPRASGLRTRSPPR